MVTIELEFLTGRFHATPWGRNVNEGDVEWPPSPFRIARAVIDTWKRKLPDWPEERIEKVLEVFSNNPVYHLPAATQGHVRCFMNSNERDATARQKIYDAFVVMERQAKVYIRFEGEFGKEVQNDLEEILQEVGYLGRSESWVKMRCVEEAFFEQWNCFPIDERDLLKSTLEPVRIAGLVSKDKSLEPAYRTGDHQKRPASWVEEIGMSTSQLLKEGWSNHPSIRWVTYARRADALRIKPAPAIRRKHEIRSVRYALASNVLPLITETVSIAERVRAHLMGIHKRVVGNNPALVSKRFSGKDQLGNPAAGHKHVFILPMDEDGDGRIDHVIVQSQEPFADDELMTLDKLQSVWQSGGRDDLLFVLVAMNGLMRPKTASAWISTTPFVTARHFRQGRGTYFSWMIEEISRECKHHGLPEPVNVQFTDATMHTRHPYHWWEFQRNRKNQPPHAGVGVFVDFAQPVQGPFSIGTLCHFGLGAFSPADQSAEFSSANLNCP